VFALARLKGPEPPAAASTVQIVNEVRVGEQERPEPPYDSPEAATLLGFLEYQRETLQRKCRGLSDEQLRVTLPPSPITLGGLLKHLACVEDSWFTEVVAGRPLPEPWASVDFDADPDWTWHSAAADSGDALRALWAERVNRSRGIMKARVGDRDEVALSQTHPAWGRQDRVSLRWVLAHMIAEYARHNGHADLIRESIDGQTGD
jgi:uncharacterized damage-inducible protein DinB